MAEQNDVLTLDEEQKQYNALARETSDSLALFYCCIRFDVPFDLRAVPEDTDTAQKWVQYCTVLHEKGLDERNGEELCFLDGATDIMGIFGKSLNAGEFADAVSKEKAARKRKTGTEQQRKDWGTNSAKNPYTQNDYDELDRIYNALASDLVAAGGVSVKQEFILRDCAKMTLDRDKMRANGDYDKAAKLNKMIQDNLSSEGLRKKDAKPIDDVRIDSLVEALEKKGLLKNGKPCEPDEAFQIFFGRPCKYPYTRDAAEQMILINENRMRQNDGMSELVTLPDDMRLSDDLGEFAEEPNEREMEAYAKLGLVKMRAVKKKR